MTSDVTIDNVLTNVFTFCPVTWSMSNYRQWYPV
jgi:hypothetical protein